MVSCIRRSAKPHLDNQQRREYSLKVMIVSISNVSSKKRYHCELKLNNRTFARTSSRVSEKGEAAWNEIYELCNLSPVTSVTINLYKEMIAGKREKKKNIRHKIAFLTMQIEELYDRHEIKKKFPMQTCNDETSQRSRGANLCVASKQKHSGGRMLYQSDSSDSDLGLDEYVSSSLPRETCSGSRRPSLMKYLRSKKDDMAPLLSISARYQCTKVLPLTSYYDLGQFLVHHYEGLVKYLDDKLSGRRLEEVASSMVCIHEQENNAPQFITHCICARIEPVTNSGASPVILRANTIGSKAMESYMKLVGMDYLKTILEDFAMKILYYPSSLEVDPNRLQEKSFLKLTQVQLCSMVRSLCQKIFSSVDVFPVELKKVFSSLRQSLDQRNWSDLADQVLSSCLFLRFICPAILNPYLYQLIQEYPQDPTIIRNFTLISKSLQSLANQTSPVNEGLALKEPFMIPINESISKERSQMISFLRQISTESLLEQGLLPNVNRAHEFIDLGFELAVSHIYLSEIFVTNTVDQNLPKELHALIGILEKISVLLCSPSEQSSTAEMAEVLSQSCKLLTDNVKDQFGMSVVIPSNNNITNDYSRKGSAPLALDRVLVDGGDTNNIATMRYSINTTQVNEMWKNLVERAEQHIKCEEELPQNDTDLQMNHQFGCSTSDDLSPLEIDAGSFSSSQLTPTSQNTTYDTSSNGNWLSLHGRIPLNINYSPPQPSQSRPTYLNTALKSSPTKSIRMGTKAVQTIQQRKSQTELETMRRLASETELKYQQARKAIENKEEENRILRELLRNISDRVSGP